MSGRLQLGPYSAQLAALTSDSALSAYGSQTAPADIEAQLSALDPKSLFRSEQVDPDKANCCLSGLWLLHNFLERSHEISQSIKTVEGSFWHAIMHRLEGDFWNSKYWYRRVGPHPVFGQLANYASADYPELTRRLVRSGTWDAEVFVDFCEDQIRDQTSASHDLERLEWQLLFDFCYRTAVET